MGKVNFLLLCVILVVITVQGQDEEVSSNDVNSGSKTAVVHVENGPLRGEHRGHFYAFEGIPYADAPIGQRRFEPPKPYSQKWEEPFDATKPGSSCMQWNHFKFDVEDKLEGSEDCLFLNVYTPALDSTEKLPVFVYIHGGAFMFGNGDYYGPKILTTRKLVFVNLNYRLGPLGFLALENDVVPGNMGMKDQVMALKWVQKNIASFGGDPKKVSITGFSAGGASVHLHYMSPMSMGLFSRGISHSGCALNPWVFMENAKEKARKVAQSVGCPTGTSHKLIACLKEKPAEDIVRTVPLFQPYLYNPFSPFAVTVEPKHEGAFLSQKPIDILRLRQFQELPWLASATEAEGLYPAGEFMRHDNYLPEIDEDWDKIVPHILDFNFTVPAKRLKVVSQQIRKHYLGTNKLDKTTFSKFVDVISDRLYKHGLAKAVKLQGIISPTYFYHFRFKTQYGDGEDMSGKNENFGVAHGEDVYLLYSTEDLRNENRPYDFDEKRMQSLLLDLYYTFGTTDQPKMGDYDVPPIDALSVAQDTLKHACVDSPDSVATSSADNFGEEEFWDSLDFDENRV